MLEIWSCDQVLSLPSVVHGSSVSLPGARVAGRLSSRHDWGEIWQPVYSQNCTSSSAARKELSKPFLSFFLCTVTHFPTS